MTGTLVGAADAAPGESMCVESIPSLLPKYVERDWRLAGCYQGTEHLGMRDREGNALG